MYVVHFFSPFGVGWQSRGVVRIFFFVMGHGSMAKHRCFLFGEGGGGCFFASMVMSFKFLFIFAIVKSCFFFFFFFCFLLPIEGHVSS